MVVTGLGVVSPVGNDKETFWNSLVSGKSGVGKLTSFDASAFDARIAAEVKDFDPSQFLPPKEMRRMARFVQFAVYSTRAAIADAGLDLKREDPHRIGVLVGSGIGDLRMIEEQHKILLQKGPSRVSPFLIPTMIVNMASGQISITFGLKGPNCSIATACASGNHALGAALRFIQHGDAEVMIAGGAESCITPIAVSGFAALQALSTRNDEPERACRPFDRDRDGFVMGEGAGIAVLESLEHARKRGARIRAELCGFGHSADAYHITAPDPDGEGAAAAMAGALADARVPAEAVSYINAHGTSTQLNDKVETMAIKKVFGSAAARLPISSNKSMFGHLLGAAGGVEFVASVLTLERGVIPPTINYENPDPECDLDYVPNVARPAKMDVVMSNSLGFGGHNATLLIRRC